FGDKQANHNEPQLILQPTQAESGELPPPRPLSPSRRAASTPGNATTTVMQQPSGSMPPVGSPPITRSTVPCDRVYNDRNCCEKDLECRDFLNRLLTDSIRSISLDITPPYDRDPEITPEENEAKRVERFRLLETRTWRDRRGAVIATGKMTNLQNGSVV